MSDLAEFIVGREAALQAAREGRWGEWAEQRMTTDSVRDAREAAMRRWTHVRETTNNAAEDGIWRAIDERIGWGYSGVGGTREMEENADVHRAIAAIRADEQQRVHDQIVGLEDRIIAEVEQRYAALVEAAREVRANRRYDSAADIVVLSVMLDELEDVPELQDAMLDDLTASAPEGEADAQ